MDFELDCIYKKNDRDDDEHQFFIRILEVSPDNRWLNNGQRRWRIMESFDMIDWRDMSWITEHQLKNFELYMDADKIKAMQTFSGTKSRLEDID